MAIFQITNTASPTTTQGALVTSGTSLKTMLQVQPSATLAMQIIEWGISVDGSSANNIKVDLVEVDVAATVTAHAASGIAKLDSVALLCGDPTTNIFQVGTSNTGFTASAEGTITAARLFDQQEFTGPGQYIKTFPLGNEPLMQCSKYTRIRITATASCNVYCYITVRA